MIGQIIILILVVSGVFLIFTSSLGLFRLPDIFIRMSAVTKAVTFKVGLIMLSVAIYFNTFPEVIKAFLIIFLLLLTTPVSSHLFGKEAHRRNTPLWKKTLRDDLKNHREEEGFDEDKVTD